MEIYAKLLLEMIILAIPVAVISSGIAKSESFQPLRDDLGKKEKSRKKEMSDEEKAGKVKIMTRLRYRTAWFCFYLVSCSFCLSPWLSLLATWHFEITILSKGIDGWVLAALVTSGIAQRFFSGPMELNWKIQKMKEIANLKGR